MQNTVRIENVEQVKFIEIYVEAGDTSDPSKLGFDYTLEFVSNKTIDI